MLSYSVLANSLLKLRAQNPLSQVFILQVLHWDSGFVEAIWVDCRRFEPKALQVDLRMLSLASLIH